MALMIGRFFNGRFLLQRDSGKYQRMLDGADYYLVLALAANGVRVTWVQFPNPALFVRGYRKDMKLVRAAASGPPSLAQDLADALGHTRDPRRSRAQGKRCRRTRGAADHCRWM